MFCFAADILGNPTLTGNPGRFEFQVGGGRSSQFDLDTKQSIAILQYGSVSGTDTIPAGTGTFSEDQAYIGLSYATNTISQIFVNIGSGKDTSQQSSNYAIGIKFSPPPRESAINMGLILRATHTTVDLDVGYYIGSLSISDGTNKYIASSARGSEKLEFTRLDAFVGASSRTGAIRYYGGICLSRITGSDTLALDDTSTVFAYPIGGGAGSSSTQQVTLDARSDLSGSHYIGGVLGLSINPDSGMGMTVELQEGIQRSVMLAGILSF